MLHFLDIKAKCLPSPVTRISPLTEHPLPQHSRALHPHPHLPTIPSSPKLSVSTSLPPDHTSSSPCLQSQLQTLSSTSQCIPPSAASLTSPYTTAPAKPHRLSPEHNSKAARRLRISRSAPHATVPLPLNL